MQVLAGLVVAAIIIGPIPDATAWSPRAVVIFPGHALGPVTLGMSAREADAAAARFARTTGRVIDVLFRNGVVAAVGSALTAHIDVQLPDDNKSFLPRDAIGGQSTLDINGSPDQLVNVFGAPRVVRESRDNLALMFAAGLIAYIQRTQARGATVSYLAVQETGSMVVPSIGNLARWSPGPTRGIVVTYLPIQSMDLVPVSSIGQLAPWSGESSEAAIVPGRSIGPVTLGMPIYKARETAALFEYQTGCNIDLLAARGVVIAAGSPWGGCLTLQVPRQTTPPVDGIGDPPALLAEVFGRPQTMHLGGDRVALVFADGLVAHVGVLHVHGGFVTYLAVQPRGWRSVPGIGHFIAWPEEHSRHTMPQSSTAYSVPPSERAFLLYSDGGSGNGLLPPPPSP